MKAVAKVIKKTDMTMTLNEKIISRLSVELRKRHKNQSDLARLTGMSRQYVYKIFNQKSTPTLNQIEKFLLPLGLTLQITDLRKPREYWVQLAQTQQPQDYVDELFLAEWNTTTDKQNTIRERLLSRYTAGHYYDTSE